MKMSQRKFTLHELEKHKKKVTAQGDLISKLKEQVEIRDAILEAANGIITALAIDSLDENGGEVLISKEKVGSCLQQFSLEAGEDTERKNYIIRIFPKSDKGADV